MKFARLYDGMDLNDSARLNSYFDHFVHLEFMKYNERLPIEKETFNSLVEAYNMTPPNFISPPDHIIDSVIREVDRQMEIDLIFEQSKTETEQEGQAFAVGEETSRVLLEQINEF